MSKTAMYLPTKLRMHDTDPYTITVLVRYLKQGQETTLQSLEESKDNIMQYVHLAVEENSHLNQYSLEKGFISHF